MTAAAKAAPAEEDDDTSVTTDDSRVKASPLARKMAKDKGIDLNNVKGSAEGGRIVKKDIEDYKPGAVKAAAHSAVTLRHLLLQVRTAPAAKPAAAPITLPTFTGEEKFTERPVTQMRKAISRRLSESLFTAPHFYVTMSIDMDQAIEARTKINAVAPVKISFNDFVVESLRCCIKTTPCY